MPSGPGGATIKARFVPGVRPEVIFPICLRMSTRRVPQGRPLRLASEGFVHLHHSSRISVQITFRFRAYLNKLKMVTLTASGGIDSRRKCLTDRNNEIQSELAAVLKRGRGPALRS